MVHSAYILPNTIISHNDHSKIYKELKINKNVYEKILNGTCNDKKYENIKIYENDNNVIGYDFTLRKRFIGHARAILESYKDELEEAKKLEAEFIVVDENGKREGFKDIKEVCDKLYLSKPTVYSIIKFNNPDTIRLKGIKIKCSSKKRLKELEDIIAQKQKMFDDLNKEYADYIEYRKGIKQALLKRV